MASSSSTGGGAPDLDAARALRPAASLDELLREKLQHRLLLVREKAVEQLPHLLRKADTSATAAFVARVTALCQGAAPDGSDAWEARHGGFLALRKLVDVDTAEAKLVDRAAALDLCVAAFRDAETRVRLAVADVLEVLARKDGIAVYERIKEPLLGDIHDNFHRYAQFHAKQQEEAEARAQKEEDDAAGAAAHQQRLPYTDVVVQDPEEAVDASYTSLFRNKTTVNPGIDELRHDTEGWKSLETSFSILQRVMAGSGKAFTPHLDDEMFALIWKSVTHTNRFVREIGYFACGTIAAICDAQTLEAISPRLTKILANGLSDNWSQVRFAASTATREYLLNSRHCQERFFGVLVPAMCLNRYYVAEGVRLYSIETWRTVMGDRGRDVVVAHIDAVVAYYIAQSSADNHAVREAACHVIAELGAKISHEAVKPHVDALLQALVICFRDESWPVRDAACGACGNFVASFPDESRAQLDELYRLWFLHCGDNIPSVREGSAVALGKVLATYKDEAYAIIEPQLRAMLARVAEQKSETVKYSSLENTTTFGVAAKKVRDNDPDLHSGQQVYSCGSLAPKLKRGSGCMDHSFRRDSEPWEVTDGALHLLAQVSAFRGEKVGEFLPAAVEACSHRHYAYHTSLLQTLCQVLPTIAKNMGKRPFKRHLESLLDPLLYALAACENRLTRTAAGQCVEAIARYIGPAIFAGRLDPHRKQQLVEEGRGFVDLAIFSGYL